MSCKKAWNYHCAKWNKASYSPIWKKGNELDTIKLRAWKKKKVNTMKLTSFSREKTKSLKKKSWQLSSHTQAVSHACLVHPQPTCGIHFSVCTPSGQGIITQPPQPPRSKKCRRKLNAIKHTHMHHSNSTRRQFPTEELKWMSKKCTIRCTHTPDLECNFLGENKRSPFSG